jgi:menaquinone-specific isochorismate synthase
MESAGGADVSAGPDGRLRSRATRVSADLADRVIASGPQPRVAIATPDGKTIVGAGTAARITADGPERFAAIRRAADEVVAGAAIDGVPAAARPRFVGGFAFGHDTSTADPWAAYPGAAFVVPATQVVVSADGGEAWLTRSAVGDPPTASAAGEDPVTSDRSEAGGTPTTDVPGVTGRAHAPDRTAWRAAVRSVLADIEEGTLQKAVLAGRLTVDLGGDVDPAAVYNRLGAAHPSCTRFCYDPGDGPAFVGATPERLVSLDGRSVRSEALAGSTGRGETPDEDDWLATDLTESAKDRHEHQLAVDAIRESLSSVATSISVGQRAVRQFSSVQHLHTPIRAELAADRHVLDIVERLHPTPAVGGSPTDLALDAIDAAEPFDRGWYAGPFGWFDAAGDGAFAVAIRSAALGDRRAWLHAGAGIVADSEPDAEWDEVQLKYRAVLDALDA